MKAKQTREKLDRLLIIGEQLSNIVWNLARSEKLPDHDGWRESLRERADAWDRAKREYRVSLAARPARKPRAK